LGGIGEDGGMREVTGNLQNSGKQSPFTPFFFGTSQSRSALAPIL